MFLPSQYFRFLIIAKLSWLYENKEENNTKQGENSERYVFLSLLRSYMTNKGLQRYKIQDYVLQDHKIQSRKIQD